MTDSTKQSKDSVLEKVEISRRGFVKSLTIGTAFAVPFIASYSMDGLRANIAIAGTDTNNQTYGGGIFWFIKRLIHKLFYIFGHGKGSM
jgi:hypothetical protein